MRNITLALGSFVTGAVCMFFFVHHTSSFRPSSVFAQEPKPTFAERAAARPVVPAVVLWTLNGVTTGPEMTFKLDGMDCVNCAVRSGGIIEYSGGAFKIQHLAVQGAINIKLNGPASNTAAFLNLFGLLGCSAPPQEQPINPNAPMLKTASFKTGTTLDFASPILPAK